MMIITHSVSWRTMCVVGLSAGGGKFLATSNTATQWRWQEDKVLFQFVQVECKKSWRAADWAKQQTIAALQAAPCLQWVQVAKIHKKLYP